MLATSEIPSADVLRKNSDICSQQELETYINGLKIQAAVEIVKASDRGCYQWVVPTPLELCERHSLDTVFNRMKQIFAPLGYKVILTNTNLYFVISWDNTKECT